MMKLDLTKPVRLKNGNEVRIYCMDGGGNYPVHGAYRSSVDSNIWIVAAWDMKGFANIWIGTTENMANLVNVPEPFTRSGWVNIYPYASGRLCNHPGVGATVYESKSDADKNALNDRIAVVPFTITGNVGDGL